MSKPGFFRRLGKRLTQLVVGAMALSILFVLLFRWVDPPYSAVMLQRVLSEKQAQEQVWVPFDAIDPHLVLAVVAAEDQRFPDHWGFDTTQIIAAVENHLEGQPLRGASTITQQVARNLYLWQGRSYVRKGLELWFTLWLELLWSKQRILEVYLNIAETGEQAFGFEVAAQRVFGRPVSKLGPSRAALLAATLPNPLRLRADRPSDYLKQRQAWVLQQMQNLGGVIYLERLHARQ